MTNFKNKKNQNTEIVQLDFSEDLIKQILNYLYQKEISSVFVEGGTYTIESFISKNYWDEARIFVGNKFFYGGIKAPAFPEINPQKIDFEETRLYFSRKI